MNITPELQKLMDRIGITQKAVDRGRVEGRVEGKVEGKQETAKQLILMGFDDKTIAKATGFSLKQIAKLKAN
jgi:predicted transposase/invertase (TIGR01784 family)